MATNYTANYGLCQWERADNFLREEFNQDNAKIDAAIKGVKEGAEAQVTAAATLAEAQLASVGHDLYGLMLQNDYDGKLTGWKKTLFFDRFQDKSLMAEASDCLAFPNQRVGLGRTVQNDISLGYGAQALFISGIRKTAEFGSLGYALLTGIKVKTQIQYVEEETADITYRVDINNEMAGGGQYPLFFGETPSEQTMLFDPPVTLSPGDSFMVSLSFGANSRMVFPSAGGTNDLGGTLLITPLYGETGTITTPVLAMPERRSCWGWVRHTGGQVALAVSGPEGAPVPFTRVGGRTTVNGEGQPCVESEFHLPDAPQSEMLAFSLSLHLGESDAMQVYDYGILLL